MYPRALSYQATLPVDDILWSKPPRPICGPVPIPPRNEPHINYSGHVCVSAQQLQSFPTKSVTEYPLPASGQTHEIIAVNC